MRALRINDDTQIAAVQALKDLTQLPVPESVLTTYGLDHLSFEPDYIIPKPFDPRLRDLVPPAVARAAIASGVARLSWPAHDPPE